MSPCLSHSWHTAWFRPQSGGWWQLLHFTVSSHTKSVEWSGWLLTCPINPVQFQRLPVQFQRLLQSCLSFRVFILWQCHATGNHSHAPTLIAQTLYSDPCRLAPSSVVPCPLSDPPECSGLFTLFPVLSVTNVDLIWDILNVMSNQVVGEIRNWCWFILLSHAG